MMLQIGQKLFQLQKEAFAWFIAIWEHFKLS